MKSDSSPTLCHPPTLITTLLPLALALIAKRDKELWLYQAILQLPSHHLGFTSLLLNCSGPGLQKLLVPEEFFSLLKID